VDDDDGDGDGETCYFQWRTQKQQETAASGVPRISFLGYKFN